MKHLFHVLTLVAFTACAPPERSGQAIINPVLNRDFADPSILQANGKYYVYATQGNRSNIQAATSTDLQHWNRGKDVLPVKPRWANKDFWAPHVIYDADIKKYVLFYSGESTDPVIGKCLGVAYANKPEGPFVDKGSPLLCGEAFVNIDPMAFQDPVTGKKLLYWGSGFQPIVVREMNANWSDFAAGSYPRPVVWPGQDNNYNILIEGAWMDYHDQHYYLYYSGDNCCGDNANYAIMVARADSATGPFMRLGEATGTGSSAILEKDSAWTAPGHNSVLHDNAGRSWIVYHAISKKDKAAKDPGDEDRYTRRVMCIRPLMYKNGWPVVERQD